MKIRYVLVAVVFGYLMYATECRPFYPVVSGIVKLHQMMYS